MVIPGRTMGEAQSRRRILIDGLPRTGTTTLARIFAIHPDTCVIIEPFHPRRYEGRHHQAALAAREPNGSLDFAWDQWNVIKHVWEADTGWPFGSRPELQVELWRSATLVIAANRRNLVKRYVSAEISRTLRFWIGTRQEFQQRLSRVSLLPLDPQQAIAAIRRDREALQRRDEFLRSERIGNVGFSFEEFFRASMKEQFQKINELYIESGLRPLPRTYLVRHATRWLDPAEYQWSSDAVYSAIPHISAFSAALANEEGGTLFTD